jgi:hypothetical protein
MFIPDVPLSVFPNDDTGVVALIGQHYCRDSRGAAVAALLDLIGAGIGAM